MMEGTGRKRLLRCVSLVLFLAVLTVGMAEILMPEKGKTTKKNGSLTIDYSHKADGYVLVKAEKGKKRYKVRVKKGDVSLNYDLNNSGNYEVFPLQYGKGNYTFQLYRNVSGKKYAEAGKITVKADMKDETRCFLYPNQYVNYDEKTLAVVEAQKICADMTDPEEIFKTIRKYMSSHFSYDYFKSTSVGSGVMPDLDGAWKKNMGICQDLAAIACSMLRSLGVPAKFVIGTLGSGTYHAWMTVFINGKEVFYDPTAELNGVNKNESYTVERYY